MKRCPKGKRRVGRACKRKPKVRAKPRAKKRKKPNATDQKNKLYAKLSQSEKAAYLKRAMPWMDSRHIDENHHLYGYRRR